MRNQVKLKSLLKATGFLKDNALVLRELRLELILPLSLLYD